MIEYDLLPKSMQQLVASIGQEATLKIVREYRNSVLNVPFNCPNQRLIDLLGIEIASLFVQEYRQVSLPIPKCDRLFKYWRNLEMRKLRDEGKSISELCKLYGLSRRQVAKCLHFGGEFLEQSG